MALADVRRAALRSLVPPPRLRLSEWIERELRLPEGVSATPGAVRLWPWQVGIALAISDPGIERITLVKPVRVGFTTLLTGAIGAFIVNEPSPILAVLPTEADCRDYVVSDIEPIFAATPALRGVLSADVEEGERNTLLSKRFAGGSLKVIASKSPRNLRRHTARILIIDEADACAVGPEGSPIALAEKRTLTFANRKIILGSTPLFEDTSHVLRAYAQSDARVYEIPCALCGVFFELMWPHIFWPPNEPSRAACKCPHCEGTIEERYKASMVNAGQWRITRPEVKGHAGFKINSLISLLPHTSWGALATEFVAAKEDTALLQSFCNTILAEGWSESGEEVDETALISRAEPFGLDAIPEPVLLITCGVDVQDDRLEASIVGWSRRGEMYVLQHNVIWGSVDDDTTWAELDELLRSKWRHPFGGQLGIDACAIDSGDGQWTSKVYSFAFPRSARRVLAIKGLGGARPEIAVSKSKMKAGASSGRLWVVGVDNVKTTLFSRLQRQQMIHFSHTLEPIYFEQLCSERRTVRYRKGQPIRRFERISGRVRAESWDCLVYSFAARAALPNFGFASREEHLKNPAAPRRSLAELLAEQIPH
jgi:phage terminase large subunit GpA-like protein